MLKANIIAMGARENILSVNAPPACGYGIVYGL